MSNVLGSGRPSFRNCFDTRDQLGIGPNRRVWEQLRGGGVAMRGTVSHSKVVESTYLFPFYMLTAFSYILLYFGTAFGLKS
jgi:hypothetical protein